jgi:hypothetical protein
MSGSSLIVTLNALRLRRVAEPAARAANAAVAPGATVRWPEAPA